MDEGWKKRHPVKKAKKNNSSENEDKIINKVFLTKYEAVQKIGEGAFGKVYKAQSNGEYFAMKFEPRANEYEYLEEEAIMMRYLKGPQIPVIKCFGKNMEYNIMVMELLGDSLEFNFTIKKKFSVKTTAMIGYQMLTILEFIHDRHIIHRDIKPDNFLMGYKEKNAILYLLDFGLAKKFRSSKTLMQYPFVRKKKMTGTARYASIHALEEMEQSRRDDLEAMAYVLLYFLRGSLPWQGIKVKSKENRYKKILVKKKETTSDVLCETFPEEFKYLVDYTRNLGYTENPDYEQLRNNFMELVKEKMCRDFDFIYDWTTKSDIQQRDDNIDILKGNFGENKMNINKNGENNFIINEENNGENKNIEQKNNNNENNNNLNNNKENNNENNNTINNNTNNNNENNSPNNNNTNNNNENNSPNNNNQNNNKETEKVEASCCFIV